MGSFEVDNKKRRENAGTQISPSLASPPLTKDFTGQLSSADSVVREVPVSTDVFQSHSSSLSVKSLRSLLTRLELSNGVLNDYVSR